MATTSIDGSVKGWDIRVKDSDRAVMRLADWGDAATQVFLHFSLSSIWHSPNQHHVGIRSSGTGVTIISWPAAMGIGYVYGTPG